MNQPYLIEVNGLKKYFPLRDGLFGQQTGELRAVDDVRQSKNLENVCYQCCTK